MSEYAANTEYFADYVDRVLGLKGVPCTSDSSANIVPSPKPKEAAPLDDAAPTSPSRSTEHDAHLNVEKNAGCPVYRSPASLRSYSDESEAAKEWNREETINRLTRLRTRAFFESMENLDVSHDSLDPNDISLADLSFVSTLSKAFETCSLKFDLPPLDTQNNEEEPEDKDWPQRVAYSLKMAAKEYPEIVYALPEFEKMLVSKPPKLQEHEKCRYCNNHLGYGVFIDKHDCCPIFDENVFLLVLKISKGMRCLRCGAHERHTPDFPCSGYAPCAFCSSDDVRDNSHWAWSRACDFFQGRKKVPSELQSAWKCARSFSGLDDDDEIGCEELDYAHSAADDSINDLEDEYDAENDAPTIATEPPRKEENQTVIAPASEPISDLGEESQIVPDITTARNVTEADIAPSQIETVITTPGTVIAPASEPVNKLGEESQIATVITTAETVTGTAFESSNEEAKESEILDEKSCSDEPVGTDVAVIDENANKL